MLTPSTMRDHIPFDEASLYFQDPAYEKPVSFSRFSRGAIMDVPSKVRVPTRISMNIRVDSVSPMDSVSPADKQRGFIMNPAHGFDPDAWMSDLIADDESSCGTLDYSVDTIEEERINQVQRALTREVYGLPLTESVRQIKVEPEVDEKIVYEDDKMNQLDVHAKNGSEDECFGIPIGWLAKLLDNFKR